MSLSDYEVRRLQTIADNQAQLVLLGLAQAASECSKYSKEKVTGKRLRENTDDFDGPIRRSARVANPTPDTDGLSNNFFDAEERAEERAERKRRAHVTTKPYCEIQAEEEDARQRAIAIRAAARAKKEKEDQEQKQRQRQRQQQLYKIEHSQMKQQSLQQKQRIAHTTLTPLKWFIDIPLRAPLTYAIFARVNAKVWYGTQTYMRACQRRSAEYN